VFQKRRSSSLTWCLPPLCVSTTGIDVRGTVVDLFTRRPGEFLCQGAQIQGGEHRFLPFTPIPLLTGGYVSGRLPGGLINAWTRRSLSSPGWVTLVSGGTFICL